MPTQDTDTLVYATSLVDRVLEHAKDPARIWFLFSSPRYRFAMLAHRVAGKWGGRIICGCSYCGGEKHIDAEVENLCQHLGMWLKPIEGPEAEAVLEQFGFDLDAWNHKARHHAERMDFFKKRGV
jgi:hypothetical protein